MALRYVLWDKRGQVDWSHAPEVVMKGTSGQVIIAFVSTNVTGKFELVDFKK